MAAEEFGTALAVLQDLAHMLDLYPPPKKQVIDIAGTARLVIIEEIVEMMRIAACVPGTPRWGRNRAGLTSNFPRGRSPL
jgi:hypothetical protein